MIYIVKCLCKWPKHQRLPVSEHALHQPFIFPMFNMKLRMTLMDITKDVKRTDFAWNRPSKIRN